MYASGGKIGRPFIVTVFSTILMISSITKTLNPLNHPYPRTLRSARASNYPPKACFVKNSAWKVGFRFKFKGILST